MFALLLSDWLLYWIGFLFIPVVSAMIVMCVVAGRTMSTKTFWIMWPIGAALVAIIDILIGGSLFTALPFAVFWGWFIRRIALASQDQRAPGGDITSLFGK